MRNWRTIIVTQTMGEFVDAFNLNAENSAFIDKVLGYVLYNGVLYNGDETIGRKPIAPLTNIDLTGISPFNVLVDNFTFYFNQSNKMVDCNMLTLNLHDYQDGQLHFIHFKDDLSYTVTQSMYGEPDELLFARFVCEPDGAFNQFYVMFQRCGTDSYNASGEFYNYEGGLIPTPIEGTLNIGLTSADVKRSGIDFSDLNTPDLIFLQNDPTSKKYLRYVESDNTVNYLGSKTYNIISNKILNYDTKSFTTVPAGKYSIQRILYDLYEGTIIMQYGDTVYNDFNSAMLGSAWLKYPAPFGERIYLPLGIVLLKSGTTDLSNEENLFLVRTSLLVDQPASVDSRIDKILQGLQDGSISVKRAQSLLDSTDGKYYDGKDYRNYDKLVNKLTVVNNLNETSFNNKKVLSAYQGKVLDNKKLNLSGGQMTGDITRKGNGNYIYCNNTLIKTVRGMTVSQANDTTTWNNLPNNTIVFCW